MYTNQTAHFHLPQYVAGDIHNELTDDNEAYRIIDNALYEQGTQLATSEEHIQRIDNEVNNDSTGVKAEINLIKQVDERQDNELTSIRTSVLNQDEAIQLLQNNVNGVSNRVSNNTTAIDNLDVRVRVLEESPVAEIDNAMSDSSSNAVMNRVIKAYVDENKPSYSYDAEEEAIIFS